MKTWVQIPSTQVRGQVWWCASIIIPEPRGWRQEDLWSSLASPNWGASGSLRESISKCKLEREWGRCLSLIAGFHMSVFTHAPTNTCAHIWTCTYMHITDRVLGAFCFSGSENQILKERIKLLESGRARVLWPLGPSISTERFWGVFITTPVVFSDGLTLSQDQWSQLTQPLISHHFKSLHEDLCFHHEVVIW